MNSTLKAELQTKVQEIKNGLNSASVPPTTEEVDDLKAKTVSLERLIGDIFTDNEIEPTP